MRRNGGSIPREEMGRCMVMFLEAFKGLSAAQKQVFVLRRVRGLKYSQIAAFMKEQGVVDRNGNPRNAAAWRQVKKRAVENLEENFKKVLKRWKDGRKGA
jgi:hypothetical protein